MRFSRKGRGEERKPHKEKTGYKVVVRLATPISIVNFQLVHAPHYYSKKNQGIA
jgi:hypothetical protein